MTNIQWRLNHTISLFDIYQIWIYLYFFYLSAYDLGKD